MKRLLLLGLTCLLAFSVMGCSADEKKADNASASISSEVKNIAADASLKSLSGDTVKLSSLHGDKPLYINFWASWCPPCVKEMPEIDNLYKKYGDKINFAAISVDTNVADAKAFAEKSQLQVPVYTGDVRALSQDYQISAIPVSIILDKNGKILAHKVGGMSEAELEKFLEPVLK
jgi:cytochrome c biogenesis protein CcmG/thiol:disulfide interchange protein DsbE